MTRSSKTRIRILTYNIHKCIGGVDRRYDLDRIVEVIGHYQPDIAFLQEVDDGVPRSRHDRQVELIAEKLGYSHTVFQRNVNLKQGHYGNAILSRFRLDKQVNLNLTVSIKKCRKALITRARVQIGEHTRSLVLCNTHLGLAGFERTIQIKKMLACPEIAHLHHGTPIIVGGDFNDIWLSHGRKQMFPCGFQCAVKKTKTFPAFLPVRSLDAIYYRGDLELQDSFPGRTVLARQASDHLPVVADFDIG
ncbi:MAG: endonuclease/exonuclease/phosphatase family metal-dependent hydrolase [Mariniblastus sp.]|jgi:endonuclease/exonuclease/phosphatase family metal-dependent hydrolase